MNRRELFSRLTFGAVAALAPRLGAPADDGDPDRIVFPDAFGRPGEVWINQRTGELFYVRGKAPPLVLERDPKRIRIRNSIRKGDKFSQVVGGVGVWNGGLKCQAWDQRCTSSPRAISNRAPGRR